MWLKFSVFRHSPFKFCTNLLTNRAPKPEYVEELEAKKLVHHVRMDERVEDDVENLTEEMFNKALREIWMKKGKKYEFTIKGGYDMKNALFHLFQKVWSEEVIPYRWTKTTLLQLWKRKGSF